MSSAKKLTLILLLLTFLLIAMLVLRPKSTKSQIQVELIENTLTQSLDGQRRYFLINSAITGKQLMLVTPTADCQTGTNITIEQNFVQGQVTEYRFISCP